MASILAAGAAAIMGTLMVRVNPEKVAEQTDPDNYDPTLYGQGIWKPTNTNAFQGTGVSEAVVANADPDVLAGGPDDSGDSRADPKDVARRFDSLHRRNLVGQQVATTQLFNPYFLQRYNNTGNQSPLIMADLSDHGSVVPYQTSLDYSPFILRGWQPIKEYSNVTDYGPTVQRSEHATIKIDNYPTAIKNPPTRPASKGLPVSTFGGIMKKSAKDITVKRRNINSLR